MGKARLFYLAQVPVPPSVLDFIPSDLVLNANALVVQANTQFLEDYSLSREQVIGQSLDILSPGITRESALHRAVDTTLPDPYPHERIVGRCPL